MQKLIESKKEIDVLETKTSTERRVPIRSGVEKMLNRYQQSNVQHLNNGNPLVENSLKNQKSKYKNSKNGCDIQNSLTLTGKEKVSHFSKAKDGTDFINASAIFDCQQKDGYKTLLKDLNSKQVKLVENSLKPGESKNKKDFVDFNNDKQDENCLNAHYSSIYKSKDKKINLLEDSKFESKDVTAEPNSRSESIQIKSYINYKYVSNQDNIKSFSKPLFTKKLASDVQFNGISMTESDDSGKNATDIRCKNDFFHENFLDPFLKHTGRQCQQVDLVADASINFFGDLKPNQRIENNCHVFDGENQSGCEDGSIFFKDKNFFVNNFNVKPNVQNLTAGKLQQIDPSKKVKSNNIDSESTLTDKKYPRLLDQLSSKANKLDENEFKSEAFKKLLNAHRIKTKHEFMLDIDKYMFFNYLKDKLDEKYLNGNSTNVKKPAKTLRCKLKGNVGIPLADKCVVELIKRDYNKTKDMIKLFKTSSMVISNVKKSTTEQNVRKSEFAITSSKWDKNYKSKNHLLN